MNKISVLAAALAAMCAFFTASAGFAADDSKLTGTVKVVKDDAGAVKKVTLTVGDGASAVADAVVQDEKGKEIAKFDGKKCTITGTVEEKEGEKLLTVKESKEARAEKSKNPEHPEHPK